MSSIKYEIKEIEKIEVKSLMFDLWFEENFLKKIGFITNSNSIFNQNLYNFKNTKKPYTNFSTPFEAKQESQRNVNNFYSYLLNIKGIKWSSMKDKEKVAFIKENTLPFSNILDIAILIKVKLDDIILDLFEKIFQIKIRYNENKSISLYSYFKILNDHKSFKAYKEKGKKFKHKIDIDNLEKLYFHRQFLQEFYKTYKNINKFTNKLKHDNAYFSEQLYIHSKKELNLKDFDSRFKSFLENNDLETMGEEFFYLKFIRLFSDENDFIASSFIIFIFSPFLLWSLLYYINKDFDIYNPRMYLIEKIFGSI